MKQDFSRIIIVIGLLFPFIVLSQEYGLSTKSKKAIKYYNNGQHFLKENSIYTAKENFELAIKEDPEFYEAYMILGDIYEQEENDSAAVRYYTNAVTVNPDFFPPPQFQSHLLDCASQQSSPPKLPFYPHGRWGIAESD